MNTRTTHGFGALTEKEKQTLRLMARGHDAKSIARTLDLSVHTINERLRDARRKMAVSSSREAARLLLDREGDDPNSGGDITIGEAASSSPVEQAIGPTNVGRPAPGRDRAIIGVALMTLALGFLALLASPQLASAPTQDPAAPAQAATTEVTDSARQFLVLIDQGRWADSYRATGKAFQRLNTSKVWAAVSEKVRPPLGAVISRMLISQENLPAPPHGYEVVKFRTQFANKADAVETVTLDREDGGWRVVGVTIG